MPDDHLLTIGAFARRCGLTASALRFYDDTGLLAPATVDAATGYRFYAPEQTRRARQLSRLRAMGMSLAQMVEVLDAQNPNAAARFIDDHVADATHRLDAVRTAAAEAKAALPPPRPVGEPAVATRGVLLASAIEQVLTATTLDPDLPVLNGVYLEAQADALVLTATDRYRLATRTLRHWQADGPWTATVHADDLRAGTSWLRRRHRVTVHTTADRVLFTDESGEHRACRTLPAEFPDYRRMLDALSPVRTRVVTGRNALLGALEQHDRPRVRIAVGANALQLPHRIPATVTGPGLDVEFELTTLHPAIEAAIGPDLMLDFAGHDQPVVIRSADDGDLTTLAMPVAPDRKDAP